MCDWFFYQPKEAWEKFEQGEILEDISKLQQELTENDKIQSDLRKKSPFKKMKI
ncbi:hypothetical protein [Spiroplasma sp. AdecLV25b]|uniref:hypothetical protein n=1 Tax=Spiroplasma sp. AdecLV25b TaxID=3027162 RepID=UPI0027E1B054|nr:hypothetical protein [Spiroplasma sp. AdecLV25b]